MLKDKATELLQGGKDQIADVTGAELPSADGLADQAGSQVSEAGQGVTEAGQNVAEGAQGAVTDAQGAATDVSDKLTGR